MHEVYNVSEFLVAVIVKVRIYLNLVLVVLLLEFQELRVLLVNSFRVLTLNEKRTLLLFRHLCLTIILDDHSCWVYIICVIILKRASKSFLKTSDWAGTCLWLNLGNLVLTSLRILIL